MTEKKGKGLITAWRKVKAKNGFRRFLTFLIFVVISALFWAILALNDYIQDDIKVKIQLANVPDSITFITDPPEDVHVMVRDRGTSLWRNGVFSRPVIELNFREFAKDGKFYVSRGELVGGAKKLFGQSASIISMSLDSIMLTYTMNPGKRVPVEVNYDITAAVGKIISGKPKVSPQGVLVYGSRDALDSILKVTTDRLRDQDLQESKTYVVKLKKIPGVRLEPAEVKVRIEVEPLVRKQALVNITIDNLPEGVDLLLFPSTANVEYYLPMSKFGNSDDKVEVRVDYRDLESGARKLPLHLGRHSDDMTNLRLIDTEVEYTLVKN